LSLCMDTTLRDFFLDGIDIMGRSSMLWKVGMCGLVGFLAVAVYTGFTRLPDDSATSLHESFEKHKSLKTSESELNLELPDAVDFFGLEKAWQLSFAHAVNSFSSLLDSTRDSSVHMLEADVLIGSVPDLADLHPNSNIPIMAHPPATTSDIDFSNWLSVALNKGKGIKLDIKTQDTVLPVITDLKRISLLHLQRKNAPSYNLPPIWLNADVVDGPRNTKVGIDGNSFVSLSKELMPSSTLSLGWGNDGSIKFEEEMLTQTMVEAMFSLCQQTLQPVTFPVRFGLVKKSWTNLKWLLDHDKERFSLTIYHCKLDDISDQLAREVYALTKNYKVYYDLTYKTNEELFGQIQLVSEASSGK